MIAAQADLIGAEMFALDGCKIDSNAAREHSGTHAELREKMEKLEQRLAAMMEGHRDQDSENDGEDQERPDTRSGIKRYQAQIERIKDFLGDHKPRLGTRGQRGEGWWTPDNRSSCMPSL